MSANRLLVHEITTDWHWCNAILLVPVTSPNEEEEGVMVVDDLPAEEKPDEPEAGSKFYLEHYV